MKHIFFNVNALIFDVFVNGSLVYVASLGLGVKIFDLSDPLLPLEIGSLDVGFYPYCVYVVGSYAYVGEILNGLRIMDVSNPAELLGMTILETGGHAKEKA